MECVILVGAQASGKSSFYRVRFFRTHVRISLDMLRTRHRESRFLRTCIETRQALVIDNTNPRRADRARYIAPAREAGFTVVGFELPAPVAELLGRNALRPAGERVPEEAIRGTVARLEPPALAEGFDRLARVEPDEAGGLAITEWSGP